jgi:chaperonin GroES
LIDYQGDAPEAEIEPANEDTGVITANGQTYAARLLEFAEAEGDISDRLSDEELAKLGMKVVEDYERDDAERSEWKADVEKALKQAAQDPAPAKTYPFEGASRVQYPILVVAAQQFAARAYPAIVRGDEAARVKVIGADKDGLKAKRAERVKDYLNYLLFYEMPDWEQDVDVMLNQIPIIGMGFKKVYYDPRKGVVSEYVNALRLTVPKDTTSLDRCPRVTQDFDRYPYEIASLQRSGVYRSVDIELTPDTEDEQQSRILLEQHRLEDLDGDGIEEPYVITVDKETQQVLRIEAAFTEEDVGFDKKGEVIAIRRWMPFVEFPFLPDPKGGFYAIGFGKLLENITAVINTSINQLLDAGHAQVAGGGFITAGLRIQGAGQGSTVRFKPGEYKTVNTPSGIARDAVWERTIPQPSAVLFSLLDLVLGAAKDISSVKDVLTGDTPATAPVGTTLALIEQGLQQFTSIYKRIFRSERTELRKVYECIQRWGSEKEYLSILDDPAANFAEDFKGDGNDILPVSDPTVVTRAQALAKAQFAMQFMEAPFANGAAIMLDALKAAEIDEPERLMAPPQQGPPPGAQEEIEKIKSETVKNETQAVLNMAKAGQATGEVIGAGGVRGVEGAPGDQMGAQQPPEGLGGPEGGMAPPDMGGGGEPLPVDPEGIADPGGQLPQPVGDQL